ncbi:MAG: putative protein N(5)-glutamine methyltransferase [Marmoricola sp.]|nr:putative protein N(5)-glutamine methyltransferase [Marmoricola sp.]
MPDDLVDALRAAGCVFAEDEATVLRQAEAEGGDLGLMLARRVAGEPLEQVVGWAEFCGLRIRTAPGVFVPRQRTRLVVEATWWAVRQRRDPVVVDLCCGTGAIGVAVAARVPGLELHAADVDPDAVACARVNLAEHVPGGQVHEGDLYDALPPSLAGRVDAVAVNAPYVPSGEIRLMPPEARLHEHHVALDGGQDGLEIHRRVAGSAADWLVPGGRLVIETSAAQAEGTAEACRDAGLVASISEEDGAHVVRAVSR